VEKKNMLLLVLIECIHLHHHHFLLLALLAGPGMGFLSLFAKYLFITPSPSSLP